jgi:hypothetical protein
MKWRLTKTSQEITSVTDQASLTLCRKYHIKFTRIQQNHLNKVTKLTNTLMTQPESLTVVMSKSPTGHDPELACYFLPSQTVFKLILPSTSRSWKLTVPENFAIKTLYTFLPPLILTTYPPHRNFYISVLYQYQAIRVKSWSYLCLIV